MGIRMFAGAAVAALLSTSQLGATTLTFDTTGDCLTSEVTITTGAAASACIASFAPDNSPAILVNNFKDLTDSFWTATFNSLMSFVSVDLGDYGADDDELFLSLFDASNNLISTVLLSILFSDRTMHTLSYDAGTSIIAKARFGTTGNLGLGGILADNLSFRGDPVAPVPLPASGLLVMAGLGAVGALRMRRKG